MRYRVLVTDYVWPTLDRERSILEPLGVELVPSPSGDEDTLARLAAGVDGIMTCFASVTPAVVRAPAQLKVVARYGIGVDNIAVDVATGRDAVVTNVPDYCVEEVAEHALALLFACARRLTKYDRAVRDENWNSAVGTPLYRIAGKTLGIVGFGQIGRRMAAKAQALGLHVLAYSPRLTPADAQEADCRAVSLRRTPNANPILSVCTCRLRRQSARMFDREQLPGYEVRAPSSSMLPAAGWWRALRSLRRSRPAISRLPASTCCRRSHPVPDERRSSGKKTSIVTPHVAFYSEESLAELQTRTAQSVAHVLSGTNAGERR